MALTPKQKKWLWRTLIILILLVLFSIGGWFVYNQFSKSLTDNNRGWEMASLYKDSMTQARNQLADCQQGKKQRRGTYTAPRNNTYIPPNNNSGGGLTTSSGQFSAPENSYKAPTVTPTVPKYSYTEVGDANFVFSTISDQGTLCHCFREGVFPGSEFRLNSPNGLKFIFKSGIYVCDTGIIVLESMMEKNYLWNIFDVQGSLTNGYPTYQPHEWLKGVISDVRGTISGRISAEDLSEIGEKISEVRAGRIAPNGVYVTASDGNEYGGWEFHTRIIYKKN